MSETILRSEHEVGEHARTMLAPFTSSKPVPGQPPLVMVKAEGCYVYDKTGKSYLDGLAGLWSTSLGVQPRLAEAAKKQMDTLPYYHSFWNRTTDVASQLSSELVDLGKALDVKKVFFTTSGSEANDTNVKVAWYYWNALGKPERKKIIARHKAYHGVTIAASSLSGLPTLHKAFDPIPLDFVRHTDTPHFWRHGRPGETESEFSGRLAQNLENLILKEGPETVAAFVAEPIMGAGGVIPPPEGYFEKIQQVLKKYKILFIADEVVTAFGRVGYMFGSEHFQIKPDLITTAKAISNAYVPLGASFVSQRVADVVDAHSGSMGTFGHGFTYSGHPVSCAVALEALKIYRELDIPRRVREDIGPAFQSGLRMIGEESQIVGEVRGNGMMAAMELARRRDPERPLPPELSSASYLASRALEYGLIVRAVGDIVILSPPLVLSHAELSEMMAKLRMALQDTENMVAYKT